jgi:hypothetical protein
MWRKMWTEIQRLREYHKVDQHVCYEVPENRDKKDRDSHFFL